MKAWFDRARAMEKDPRVLQAAPFPMQPWLDVAEGGWAAVVVTDDDRALAERLADELADLAWSLRDDFQERRRSPSTRRFGWPMRERRASSCSATPATRCSAGSAGDSNILLEAMLRLEDPRPRPDPDDRAGRRREAFRSRARARRVTLPLGGEAATAFFRPIEVTGTVTQDRRRRRYHRRLPSRLDRHGPHGQSSRSAR